MGALDARQAQGNLGLYLSRFVDQGQHRWCFPRVGQFSNGGLCLRQSLKKLPQSGYDFSFIDIAGNSRHHI